MLFVGERNSMKIPQALYTLYNKNQALEIF
jgi:hypothetical protein